jgi:hypothetical protein
MMAESDTMTEPPIDGRGLCALLLDISPSFVRC